jgi:hypothetical protein
MGALISSRIAPPNQSSEDRAHKPSALIAFSAGQTFFAIDADHDLPAD